MVINVLMVLPLLIVIYTSINTNPYSFKENSGSKIRFLQGGIGWKLASQMRGTQILGGLADQGNNFMFVGNSIRGPQNWCVDVAGGSQAIGQGAYIVMNDCHGGSSQQWYRNDRGAIVLANTSYCIAPSGVGQRDINLPLILAVCDYETAPSWGDVGRFSSQSQVSCLHIFMMSEQDQQGCGVRNLHTPVPTMTMFSQEELRDMAYEGSGMVATNTYTKNNDQIDIPPSYYSNTVVALGQQGQAPINTDEETLNQTIQSTQQHESVETRYDTQEYTDFLVRLTTMQNRFERLATP